MRFGPPSRRGFRAAGVEDEDEVELALTLV